MKDLDKTEKTVLIIIAFSLLGRLFFLPFIEGLWWDEVVYLTLGRNLPSGIYSLDASQIFETERPPLVPILVSPFSESILLSRLLLSMLSILGVLTSYYLTKETFSRRAAIWSSLFLSTGYFFLFFTMKVLSEGVFILFLSLSVLFFIRGIKTNKIYYYLVSGIFTGLTIMARHFGVLLLIVFLISLLYLFITERKKRYLGFIVIITLFAALTISPWFLLTSKYYSGPLDTFLAKFSHVSGPYNYSIVNTLLDYPIVWYFSTPFIFIGIFFLIKNKIKKVEGILLFLFVLSVAFYLLLPGYKEPRYLMGFMPIAMAIAGFGMVKFSEKIHKRKLVYFSIIVIYLISIGFSYFSIWDDRLASKETVEAGLYLKSIGEKDDVVMTLHHPYVYYLSQKRVVFLPKDQNHVESIIKNNKVKFVLINKWDKEYPGTEFFGNSTDFVKLASFGRSWDPEIINIYKVV